ncbi:hypothetical protein J8L70_08080 [Pseudoalteromonas sp. MMG010]|uniref:hypothetical protein n=1 Tax=Pseudoalteromonas sp. MMG010 TaxID=2822685 RepID=UPI001B39DBC6|nr:hypothetical protein [Pseudoalteromonas sp. MMG010]MBQ4833196.1 hypothetical protein [Pseudoalteromonas sp. MMG010]
MQLATFLRNTILGDDAEGRAIEFVKVPKNNRKEGIISISLEKDTFLSYIIWPMNTFHIIARMLDTFDVYQNVLSLKNYSELPFKCSTGRHDLTWRQSILFNKNEKTIEVTQRFYELLYNLFKSSNASQQVSDLLQNHTYFSQLIELFNASDSCAFNIKNTLFSEGAPAYMAAQVKKLARSESSAILSFSNCNSSYGSVHYKTHTPQSGISLNSLSHDLAYVKAGVEINSLPQKVEYKNEKKDFNILLLPWPLKVEDNFFNTAVKPRLQMDDEFGFFSYSNLEVITAKKIIYAIEGSDSPLDLVVIPECSIDSENKQTISSELSRYFKNKHIEVPTFIFGVFAKGTDGSYGENSLSVLVWDENTSCFVAETQQKHHRWAIDQQQVNNYDLQKVFEDKKLKWWENCLIGSRKLLSFEKSSTHICPLICEDLARQEPISGVLRSLAPHLVVALLLDGPQLQKRWPGHYSHTLVDEPGSSVLTISPYGIVERSTNGGEFPKSNVISLWSEPNNTKEIELDNGKAGVVLTLVQKESKQWTADGRLELKKRLTYKDHRSIGSANELSEK